MTKAVLRALFVGGLLTANTAFAQTPSHVYQLNGDFHDQTGTGPLHPDLGHDGGSIGPTGYTFGADQGLFVNLADVWADGTYTIAFNSRLDALSGFRKLLDFKNQGSDNGLYNLNTAINFFPYVTGPTGAYNSTDLAFTVITRDGLGNVNLYVDDVFQASFADGTDATFVPGIARFFEDDNHTGGSEASSGFVDYIATYNGPLDATQISTLKPVGPVSSTPEPASFVLFGTGLVGLGAFARRRAKKQ